MAAGLRPVVLAGFLLLASGCAASPEAIPRPSICDGIPADMGGCSPARPVFAGSTCEEIGREWGRWLDAQVVSIMSGPSAVDGKARSVLIGDALVLGSVVAGGRLHELGQLADCDVPAFLAAAEGAYSPALVSGIGAVLFDGDPVASEADWRLIQERYIRIIDEGE